MIIFDLFRLSNSRTLLSECYTTNCLLVFLKIVERVVLLWCPAAGSYSFIQVGILNKFISGSHIYGLYCTRTELVHNLNVRESFHESNMLKTMCISSFWDPMTPIVNIVLKRPINRMLMISRFNSRKTLANSCKRSDVSSVCLANRAIQGLLSRA